MLKKMQVVDSVTIWSSEGAEELKGVQNSECPM